MECRYGTVGKLLCSIRVNKLLQANYNITCGLIVPLSCFDQLQTVHTVITHNPSYLRTLGSTNPAFVF